MKLHAPFHLAAEQQIKDAALALLQAEWDFKTERLLRMPMEGSLFDSVNDELNSKGYPPISIWTIFARGANNEQVIHADAASSTVRVNTGIIIPVLGTAGSKMQWYDENDMDFRNVLNADKRSTLFLKVSEGMPRLIEELEVTESILANVSIPHRAIASNTPRAVVSIKLVGNPILL